MVTDEGPRIIDVINKLEADTVNKRKEGIDELRRILNDRKAVSRVESLRDDGFHKALETLFRLIRTDKDGSKKGSATSRSKSESRLETAGQAFGMMIDVCATRIKYKTAHAVLDHISDIILPDSQQDDGLYRPLRYSYLRSLRVVLSHLPHVEHIRPKQLRHLLAFILDAIDISVEDEAHDSTSTLDPSHSIRSSKNRSFRTTQSQNSLGKGLKSSAATYMDDLLLSLKSLTAVFASLLIEQAEMICNTLLSALSAVPRLARTSFEVISDILLILLKDDLTRASSVVRLVVPYCCRILEDGNSGLREQALEFLFLSRYLLSHGTEWTVKIDDEQLEYLIKALSTDNIRRQDRERLNISDLRFNQPRSDSFLCVAGVHPRPEAQTAVASWTSLQILSLFKAASWRRQKDARRTENGSGPQASSKRLRQNEPVEELIEACLSPEPQKRLLSMQLLFFSLTETITMTMTAMRGFDQLADGIGDDARGESSWALLVLGRYFQILNKDLDSLSDMTRKIWQKASRLLVSPANSTAASFVMASIIHNPLTVGYVTQKIQSSVFPLGGRGPHSLSDAALLLHTACLRSLSTSNERAFDAFAAQAMRWLDDVWSVPTFTMEDHARTSWLASVLRPRLVCQFLLAATQTFYDPPETQDTVVYNRLHAAFLNDRSELGLYHFLTGNKTLQSDKIAAESDWNNTTLSERQSRSLAQVVNFLLSKAKELQTAYEEALFKATHDEAGLAYKARVAVEHSTSAEVLTALCVVCIDILYLLRTDIDESGLRQPLSKIWQHVLNAASSKRDEAFLEITCSMASVVKQSWLSSNAKHLPENSIGINLSADLIDLTETVKDRVVDDDIELDLLDDDHISGQSQSQSRSQALQTSTSIEPLPLNNVRIMYTQARINLLRTSLHAQHASPSESNKQIYDLVLSFGSEELMAVRPNLLEHIYTHELPSRSEASRLLKHIAQICLQQVDLDRHESALCFCLRTLNAFAKLWLDHEDDELSSVAWDIYSWFVEMVLEKKQKSVASVNVLIDLSKVLHNILLYDPRYGSESLPSPRTNLLQLLRQGGPSLKFEVVPTIAKLFDGYVLTEHPAIFNDIVDQLPTDPDNSQGIAARIFILGSLGERWHTILRQAVYHIFETVANVPIMTNLAHKCLLKTCANLGLSRPRHLLDLYAPQILWTWLEHNTVETMPFQAFGFRTLPEMLRAVEDEVVAQLALRPSTGQQNKLASLLNVPWDDLLVRHFARVRAYGTATTSASQKSFESESISTRLASGTRDDGAKAKEFLPDVLAILTVSLRDDKGFEKSLGSDTSNAYAVRAYATMIERGCSSIQPPTRQQPSFRAKDFLRMLDQACGDTGVSTRDVWSSALVTHVLRTLFDDAREAMGSLHALSNVKKIRIVIALSGDTLIQGYPLEMLLYNLRPYLTVFQCTEDVIGIFWYLLDRAKAYLETRTQFLAGIGVMIFLSLSSFVAQPQDSTTQASHYRATMDKVQDFRAWLATYFLSVRAKSSYHGQGAAFRNLMKLAEAFTGGHSSSKETPTGRFLLSMLNDQSEKHPTLDRRFFLLALKSIAHDFIIADDQNEDILQGTPNGFALANVLWNALSEIDASSKLRAWFLLSLGRIYAVEGPMLLSHLREAALEEKSLVQTSGQARHSYRELLRSVLRTVSDQALPISSCAELTLSWLASKISPTLRQVLGTPQCPPSLLEELAFEAGPVLIAPQVEKISLLAILEQDDPSQHANAWASSLALQLCEAATSESILRGLQALLAKDSYFARTNLKFIVHILLQEESERKQEAIRQDLSGLFEQVLGHDAHHLKEHQRIIVDILVYLRSCLFPGESGIVSRNLWLNVDLALAAQRALSCGLPETALFLFEAQISPNSHGAKRSSRRSSVTQNQTYSAHAPDILRSVHDTDFFYGAHEEDSVGAVFQKLQHEGIDDKALAIQTAVFEASLKSRGLDLALQEQGNTLVSSLAAANLNALAYATQQLAGITSTATDFDTATSILNTHQWDFGIDAADQSPLAAAQAMLQTTARVRNKAMAQQSFDNILQRLSEFSNGDAINELRTRLPISAAISEAKEFMSAHDAEQVSESWEELTQRSLWAELADVDTWATLCMAREANFAAIKRNEALRSDLKLSPQQALLLEIKAVRQSLTSASFHFERQFSLNRALYLQRLGQEAEQAELYVRTSVEYDLANTLWSQGEVTAPIQILRKLVEMTPSDEAILISKTDLLAELGQKLSDARLSRPDEVTSDYLLPAIKALGSERQGSRAGKVFHNFANFCDEQLRDAAGKEELDRVSRIRGQKFQELQDLAQMAQTAQGKTRDLLRQHHQKAKQWFKLDEEELQRLQANREQLTQRCLENYLLSLQACDVYDRDVLRFLALWLGVSEASEANHVVHEYIGAVPSSKFAPFINQLTSRLSANESVFQQALIKVVYTLCQDHPYHSMYQLFAASKSKVTDVAKNDDVAAARLQAAKDLVKRLLEHASRPASIYRSIHNSNIVFVKFAQESNGKDVKSGAKVAIKQYQHGEVLVQTMKDLSTKIPPPTMHISLRRDKDYSKLPVIDHFEPQISVAGGVSAPKITTIVSTDGSKHKLLLKGGNDDLRQDAIMEQVFEQVSTLLRDYRPTRKRELGIRTYKVVPLTYNSGIIEFVKDTIPLNDYLLPAHQRYFPKDWKANKCRSTINDAQKKPFAQRLSAYRTACENFHPVMRFFFMERFMDPDVWFQKRLNYSRTTAAISMLGHVLGLGDRHGHNILLDEQSGEVVHIDLGVAFEMGRVLPIPEVVPFRLTRDLVDGMGFTGVEGPFRRCCNFTLEALRKYQDVITTILDVLRWDPLYSWSVSPLRLQRMQQNQEQRDAAAKADVDGSDREGTPSRDGALPARSSRAASTTATAQNGTTNGAKDDARQGNQASEADRALAVVSKKLSANLSVEATVNELIRQATDERNLAVLYSGWAAYA